MGKKYDSLNHLKEAGINVHEYESLSSLEELERYAQQNHSFSIRFDRDTNYHQLPFYTYDEETFSLEERKKYFEKIVEEAKNLDCTMLVSNGHQYDVIERCNFVIRIEGDLSFTLEYGTTKVPLRNMYEYPTSVISGTLSEEIKNMNWINKEKNNLTEEELEEILAWAMSIQVKEHTVEGTLYEKPVGIQKQKIVCWQID